MVYELEAVLLDVFGPVADVVEKGSPLFDKRLDLCLVKRDLRLLLDFDVVDGDRHLGQPVFHRKQLVSGKGLHIAKFLNLITVIFEHLTPLAVSVLLKQYFIHDSYFGASPDRAGDALVILICGLD